MEHKYKLLILFLVPFLLASGLNVGSSAVPLYFIVGITALLLFFITFINTNFALTVLIFSMLLSPEFGMGGVTGRSIVLRFDDIFIFVIFFGWMAKMAVNKDLGLTKASPINMPILLYIFICILSSGLGVFQGTTRLKYSFFYILKYVEYFLVFFMVSNNITDKKQIKRFLSYMLITSVIVGIYALRFYFTHAMGRTTAPFEGEAGEPNTLAGYLIIITGLIMGMLIYARTNRMKIIFGTLMGFLVIPFVLTLSRAGWLGFLVMYVCFLIFSKRHKVLLLSMLVVAVLGAVMFSPDKITQRVTSRYGATFVGGETYRIGGHEITLDESASIRLRTWKSSIRAWMEYPIFGRGVPGGGAVSDVQYTRVLREVGIVGAAAFLWMIIRLASMGVRMYRDPEIDDLGKGISLGYLCSLMGIITMGVAAEVFIIIRIMEPFWFLSAIVVTLHDTCRVPTET